MSRILSVVVEGVTDEHILRPLLCDLDIEATFFGQEGKGRLDRQLDSYNRAAEHLDWLVVRDLDDDAKCASDLLKRVLPRPARRMVCRVAVRAIEAWLLADREGIADFLNVSPSRVPAAPELLPNPKRTLTELASGSRSRQVREDFIPRGTAKVEPGYVASIAEFSQIWRWRRAANHAPSLARCVRAIERSLGR